MSRAQTEISVTTSAAPEDPVDLQADRRRFLNYCTKAAIGMTPAVELLLMSSEASATHNPPGCTNGVGSPNHCTSLGQGG